MVESDALRRWVLYVRKSGPGDKSVADQEKVGRRDIERIGGTVVAVFKDNLSASLYRRVQDRPGFIEASNTILSGEADALWTFAHNRGHRNLDDYVSLRQLCMDNRVPWRYGGRTYELWKAADRQAANSDAVRAEGQSDDISEAVNRGIQEALADGEAHGKIARGYKIVRDPDTGKPIRREPIPVQARLIQQAAERVLAGETLRSVEADFTPAWKAVGGKGFMDQRVLRQMLLRPTYAGLRTYKGEIVREGTWEPILTVEQHEQLKVVLNDPTRKTHRGVKPAHLLSRIAVCGACGEKLGARYPKQKGKPLPPTYRCNNGHASRAIAVVDAHVTEFLMQLLERPDARALLMAKDELGQSSVDADMALIGDLKDQIKTYVRDAARTRMSAEVVAVYVEELQSQIAEARARVDAVTSQIDPLLRDAVGPDARQRWEAYTLVERRQIIRRNLSVTLMPRSVVPSGPGVRVRPLRSLTG